MKAFELVFTKMSGAGNDFLIADLTKAAAKQQLEDLCQGLSRAQLTQRLCHRTEGVGADGLVLLEPGAQTPLRWDFYNADGSEAEMCGNAARCAVEYAVTQGLSKSPLQLETKAGIIEGRQIKKEWVEVTMTALSRISTEQSMDFESETYTYSFVDSGVPHVVIHWPESFAFHTMRPLARYLRKHSRFQPQGTNVTFIHKESQQRIQAASFERGVEDFTQACGTGAVAAAFDFLRTQNHQKQVEVKMPGGLLQVSFEQDRPRLAGPARFIAEVSVYSDLIHRGEPSHVDTY